MRRNKDLNRLLIGFILLLVTLIIDLNYPNHRLGFKSIQKLFKTNISILDINNFYSGNFFSDKKTSNVSSIYLPLVLEQPYKDGYMVKSYQDVCLAIMDGTVVYACKGTYGKMVKVEGYDGRIYTYGFLDEIDVLLYENIKAGRMIGICDESYYLEIDDGPIDEKMELL